MSFGQGVQMGNVDRAVALSCCWGIVEVSCGGWCRGELLTVVDRGEEVSCGAEVGFVWWGADVSFGKGCWGFVNGDN